ncbi:o-succinylbenzoate--CoA ligase [Vibrio sp. TRT 17S01]|uniref:o-succinylbenzoate--CoA ligase n=1 Tax=Vibrio sp. TRT 17S01 TaxID=3418505 RepID=UPI003CF96443
MSTSPLTKWAQQRPSSLALLTENHQYCWQELKERVDAYAAQITLRGLKQGDVLTCIGKNTPEMMMVYLACLELGVICALTMPQPDEVLQNKLDTLYSGPPHLWWSAHASLRYTSNSIELSSSSSAHSSFNSYLPDNPASIVFTSGSTGKPKAVLHTSAQHLASASGLLEKFRFTEQHTWLLSLPLYHVSGLAIVYRWLFAGACLKVGCGELLKDIQGVTHASLVATQLKRLLESGIDTELSHVLLGGSHVPQELSLAAAERGIETWLGYGMTEAASTVTAKQINDHHSAGCVLPRRGVKLEEKRIFIKGETLAKGYYHQGMVTPLISDEWFDTKDLGEWRNNELVIIGRADNQFISGGENIHCEEIEAVLNSHEQVAQAIVIPVADIEFGTRPVAVVQTSMPIVKAEFDAFLSDKLVKFKWPVAYYVMPKSLLETGIKVSRQAVKDWLEKEVQNSD